MAVEAVRETIVEDIVNLFVCMVVLIAGCWVKTQVSTEGGSRVVCLIFEAAERPAA